MLHPKDADAVGIWRCNEPSGTDLVYDSGDFGNHGTPSTSLDLVPALGRSGTARSFSDYMTAPPYRYADMGSHASLKPQQWTFSAWIGNNVDPSSKAPGTWYFDVWVMRYASLTARSYRVTLPVAAGSRLVVSGGIEAAWSTTPGSPSMATGSTPLTAGLHLIGASFDGQYARVFLNGALDGTSGAYTPGEILYGGGVDWTPYMGKSPYTGGSVDGLEGAVEDAAFYNVAKSPAWFSSMFLGPPIWTPTSPTDGQSGVSPSTEIIGELTNAAGDGFDAGWTVEVKAGSDGMWRTAYVDGEGFRPGWNGSNSLVAAIPNGYRVEVDPVDDFPRGAVVQVRASAQSSSGIAVELAP